MIWCNDHLVRALQQAWLAERRPRLSRTARGGARRPAATAALQPATAR